MIKYFCDRCDEQVNGPDNLSTFKLEAGDDVSSQWNISPKEICPQCTGEMYGAFKLVAKEDKRPGR